MNVTNATEQLLIIENNNALKTLLKNWPTPARLHIESHSIRCIFGVHRNTHLVIGVIK